MNTEVSINIDISDPYEFSKDSLTQINNNTWVKKQWPLVYLIQNNAQKIAYVGESTNFSQRIKNHLANPNKSKLNKITIIGSEKFNKSATLDIESKLIQYMSAEGTIKIQNGNDGLVNHNYYQQHLYQNIFHEIWRELYENKIVSKSIQEIEATELFKYSPYKSLSTDQYNSVISVIEQLNHKPKNKIFISGNAGTGKTILATYLIKLLTSNLSGLDAFDKNANDSYELALLEIFRRNYPESKVAIVVAMTSLRKTLQNVFRKIPGLKASMVIGPSDTFKQRYDLLIVDEAHRLRQYKNIGWRGVFKKNNQKLGLDDSGTELDWIIANSENQIFFYDEAQSIKPSDVSSSRFQKLLDSNNVTKLQLKSQMRCAGGVDYVNFIDDLLKCNNPPKFQSEAYDLQVFKSFRAFRSELAQKENEFGLCRMVAGYSWEWKSDPKRKPQQLDAIDIEIEGLKFQWNKTHLDWINSEDAFNQIGCIHTTQGYDLNYCGVIFGREIDYNPAENKIEINESLYFDKYGKTGVKDKGLLKDYIINIYKTILYRGIKGAYIYACNPRLRAYLKSKIAVTN